MSYQSLEREQNDVRPTDLAIVVALYSPSIMGVWKRLELSQ